MDWKQWILDSPETNVKELKWQLIDMGIYINEWEIREVVNARPKEGV